VLHRSGRLELTTEDTAEIVLTHAGGCLSSLHLNFASPVRRRSAEICGTQGIVIADLRTGEIRWGDRQGNTVETMTVEIDPAAEYFTVLSDFVETLGSGLPQKCDGYAGLAAVRLADRARSIGVNTPAPAAVF
jgi:predicted dehydrogenase